MKISDPYPKTGNFITLIARYLPAMLSGGLLTLSFPKANLSWLAWISLIPLIISVKGMDGKRAFNAGFIMGVVHFFSLLYWIIPTISTYGQLSMFLTVPILILLSFYLALYPAVFALAIHFFRSDFKPLTAAAMWVALEYLRSTLFTGFPWGLTGASQYMNLPLIQIADITSVYGVSFIIVMTNGVLAMVIELLALAGKKENRVLFFKGTFKPSLIWSPSLLWSISLSVVFSFIFIYGEIRIEQIKKITSRSDHATLSVVQGNIEQVFKWDQAFQESTIAKYCELSVEASEENPDLIVWPETALPFYYGWNSDLSAQVDECIKSSGTTFLVGSPAFETVYQDAVKVDQIFNRAYMVNPNGFITGKYDKTHLVPFGEYVPLGKYLSFLGKIIAQAGDFSPGDENNHPLAFNGSSTGVLICFEVIFPYLSRSLVNKGAQILVNTTNDAWFGYTSAPEQHFSMAVFRAIENRRAVARAANTGISGFIEPTGRISVKSALYEDAVLSRSLPSLTVTTLYSTWGDLFAIICLVAMVVLFMINIIKQKCADKK